MIRSNRKQILSPQPSAYSAAYASQIRYEPLNQRISRLQRQQTATPSVNIDFLNESHGSLNKTYSTEIIRPYSGVSRSPVRRNNSNLRQMAYVSPSRPEMISNISKRYQQNSPFSYKSSLSSSQIDLNAYPSILSPSYSTKIIGKNPQDSQSNLNDGRNTVKNTEESVDEQITSSSRVSITRMQPKDQRLESSLFMATRNKIRKLPIHMLAHH